MYNEKTINGIRIVESTLSGETLVVNGNKMEECANIIKNRNIKSIMLVSDYGTSNDIDFLKKSEFNEIETITINRPNINNIDGLYALQKLKALGLSDIHKSTLINFEKLTTLKEIGFTWSNKFKNIDKLIHLEKLNIWKFPYDDLNILYELKNLKYLELNYSRIVSLEGIEDLHNIEEIELNYNRRIKSLKGLNSNHKKLKIFHCYSAPKLFEINNYLSKTINLEIILLSRLKEIDSLKFLNKLKKLKIVEIKEGFFKVKDNDFEPLTKALQRTENK